MVCTLLLQWNNGLKIDKANTTCISSVFKIVKVEKQCIKVSCMKNNALYNECTRTRLCLTGLTESKRQGPNLDCCLKYTDGQG